MKFKTFLLGAILAIASLSASADMVAHQGRDSVTITDAPCHPGILSMLAEGDKLPAHERSLLRAAHADFQGKTYTACYFTYQGAVVLFYEDGDQGIVPRQEFVPLKDV